MICQRCQATRIIEISFRLLRTCVETCSLYRVGSHLVNFGSLHWNDADMRSLQIIMSCSLTVIGLRLPILLNHLVRYVYVVSCSPHHLRHHRTPSKVISSAASNTISAKHTIASRHCRNIGATSHVQAKISHQDHEHSFCKRKPGDVPGFCLCSPVQRISCKKLVVSSRFGNLFFRATS
jgi:hypothetical protein